MKKRIRYVFAAKILGIVASYSIFFRRDLDTHNNEVIWN